MLCHKKVAMHLLNLKPWNVEMSQSVFIVSVALLIKYHFYFDETKNKPHFKRNPYIKLQYYANDILMRYFFFLVRVVMNNKTSICKMKMFDLIFGPLSPTSVSLWAYMFVWIEHWNVFTVTSMRSLLPNRMEFCVITVIVNLWVGKHRKFTSIKIYHMKVKY